MSECTVSVVRPQVRLCTFCGERPVKSRGACGRCYQRYVNPNKKTVATCQGCGQERTIQARGLCNGCYSSPDRENFSKAKGGRKMREFTPQEIARAKDLEHVFRTKTVPFIRRLVGRLFRNYPFQDREEVLAESLALAWKEWIAEVSSGRDVLRTAFLVGKHSVAAIRKWKRLTGAVSREDVISPRRVFGDWENGPLCLGAHSSSLGVLDDNLFLVEFDEWTARDFPPDVREIALFLACGGSWREAQQHFGLSPQDVTRLREALVQAVSPR